MKPKKFTVLLLFVAIMGILLWWFTRPTAAPPPRMTDAPMPVKAGAPEPMIKPLRIEKPSVAPVEDKPDSVKPASDSANLPVESVDLPAEPVDTQAELKTAIPDIVRLLRAGDPVDAYKTYTPPNEFNAQAAQQMQELQLQAQATAVQDPELRQLMQKAQAEIVQAYEALEEQTPTLNATGDEATYMFAMPRTGIQPLTFVKIDGKWYIKNIVRK